MDIAITTERADEKGWIAFAPEVRATAQGSTEAEAKENLRALFARYPDLLEEPRQASDRRVELIGSSGAATSVGPARACRSVLVGLALLGSLLVACTSPSTAATASPTVPRPTATASATVVPASQSMAPSLAPAELRSDFGIIVNLRDAASQPALRTERDTTPLATFTGGFFRQFNGAVSVDGRKIAYWYLPSEQRTPAELRVLDTAKPSEQRTLLTLRTEFPEAIVWSSDGNGLLYTVTDTKSGQGVVAEYSALRSVDLVTGVVRELARSAPRHWLFGAAWNREKGILLGSEVDGDTGKQLGMFRYGPSGAQRVNVDGPLLAMAPSPDALRMAGAFGTSDKDPFELRVWPLDDPLHYSALPADPAWPISKGWGFRPGSNEIALWRMTTTTLQLLIWDPTTGRKTTLNPRDTGRFRPDGSAVISSDGFVLEVATGRTAKIDVPAGAFISTLVRF